MMGNQNQLKDKLRSIYFGFLSDIDQYNCDECLPMLTTTLGELINSEDVAVYFYNQLDKVYEIEPGCDNKEKTLFKKKVFVSIEKIWDSYDMDGELVFNKQFSKLYTCVIPFQASGDTTGFIFFSFGNELHIPSKETLHIIQQETNKFLKVVAAKKISNNNEENHKLLFDLSMRFLSINDKSDVLSVIIKELKMIFPKFSPYLLLSQDHDADSYLPIKAIEYSDDVTKRVSTQAFITGEIQLEDRVQDRKTCLYAPLIGKQGVYGVVQIITPRTFEFPENDIEFIARFCSISGQAIENVTLYHQSKLLVNDLKLINDVTHKLNSNLDLSEIISVVRKQIMYSSAATQVGFVYLNEESEQEFDILSGSTDYFYSTEGRLFSEYMFMEVKDSGESVFSGDFKKVATLPFRSVMAIPMIHSGTIHGTVLILHEENYYFSFEGFKLMKSLIQHSTLALSNSILKDKLERAVKTDYLTKLYSRNYLDHNIKLHMETEEKGVLALFDIDDFKRINDTYGHHVGDKVIIQVSNILKMHIGEEDIPARWGGEELAIYLPDANIDEGVRLAGQIRKQAASFTEPRVTLSCGVSSWGNGNEDNAGDLFQRADRSLYEAKKLGKNSVVREYNIQKYI
ncbi:diguanylate cyclase domain-containing protein [Virgibacillus byunsanensis]|uniref:Diguanylate cyclase domain-containing protein n=1 Tax=Virgibacillus byunsanensis TaxID=570945 RepID=A0ABW3LMM3_9BACI